MVDVPGPSKQSRVEDPRPTLASRPRPTLVNRQGRKVRKPTYIAYIASLTYSIGSIVQIFDYIHEEVV